MGGGNVTPLDLHSISWGTLTTEHTKTAMHMINTLSPFKILGLHVHYHWVKKINVLKLDIIF